MRPSATFNAISEASKPAETSQAPTGHTYA
jgi:hypothetical protein